MADYSTNQVEPRPGTDALTAPPKNLAELTNNGDPRAAALWYRTGDNSIETGDTPGYVAFNDHLRRGGLDPVMRQRVADVDSVMRESVLTEPIEVYRGIDLAGLGHSPGNLVGVELTDHAFGSTTADPAWARLFATSVLRIRVPAGISAIRMADRDPTRPESEILLDRGLTYRITAEHLELDDDRHQESHTLDAEIIPPAGGSHD
jgi:hypothetical protein